MPAEYAHIVEEADTEDEYVTNPRDLFKKFNDIAAKDFGALNGSNGQGGAGGKRWTISSTEYNIVLWVAAARTPYNCLVKRFK